VPEALPLKITGILVYLNNILLPILTTYMCLVAITNNQKRLFRT
jgi:hypothetical protein